MKISEQCLERFNKNKTDFLRLFITMDETWIHHYTPESKQQSTVVRSRLFSAKEDYLEKGKTITGEYYSNLLTRLDEKIREKRPGLQKKILAMGNLRDLHYELLEHPPYSPDLAPSDFHLFPKLKLFLAGQHFSSNQEATDCSC
jgi:hypothetical protein